MWTNTRINIHISENTVLPIVVLFGLLPRANQLETPFYCCVVGKVISKETRLPWRVLLEACCLATGACNTMYRILRVSSTYYRFLPFLQHVPASSASFSFISGCQRMVWAAAWEHTTVDFVYQYSKFPHPFQLSMSQEENCEKCGILSK
jgi:hypothetical protein